MKSLTICSAEWCSPCKSLKLALVKESIPFHELDAENDEKVLIKLGISSFPTIIIKDNDKITSRIEGSLPVYKIKKLLE